MDEIIRKHVRTLPVEIVAAELAKDLVIDPLASSGYTYMDNERGYIVRIEVSRPEKAKIDKAQMGD